MDSDIPPPLDEKLRDNDFELDDEVSDEELPEIPNFNAFSGVSYENFSYSHPPPFIKCSEKSRPLSVEYQNEKSLLPQFCDVAKEKESFEIEVTLEKLGETSGSYDKTMALSNCCLEEGNLVPTVKVDVEATCVSGNKIDNIPCEQEGKVDDNVKMSKEYTNDELTATCENILDSSYETLKEVDLESLGALEFRRSIEDNFGGSTVDDITETTPVPKLDDVFNDYQTAVNQTVQQMKDNTTSIMKSEESLEEIHFQSNFFDAFNESTVDSSCVEFEGDFVTGFPEVFKEDLEIQPGDEDFSDFDDFSDFSQAPVQVSTKPIELQHTVFMTPPNVNDIVNMMFPSRLSSQDQFQERLTNDFSKEHEIINSDRFVKIFNDIDSTLALGYHYNNSKASQSLVVALGIDTRNIVS